MSTYSQVLEILDDTARQAGKANVPMRWLAVFPYRWAVGLLEFDIIRQTNSCTRAIEKASLSISGVAHRLPKIATEISPAHLDRFLTSAVNAEQAYLRMRKNAMDMLLRAKPISAKHPKIAQAYGACIESLADAFEAAQDLRWVIMECQAQQDVGAGRVQRFGNASDAIAALRS